MTHDQKYQDFVETVESVASELYSSDQWEQVQKPNKGSLGFEYTEMLSHVYEAAFSRKPEAFANIQWVNSESGYPLWVRPGIDWSPSY